MMEAWHSGQDNLVSRMRGTANIYLRFNIIQNFPLSINQNCHINKNLQNDTKANKSMLLSKSLHFAFLKKMYQYQGQILKVDKYFAIAIITHQWCRHIVSVHKWNISLYVLWDSNIAWSCLVQNKVKWYKSTKIYLYCRPDIQTAAVKVWQEQAIMCQQHKDWSKKCSWNKKI